MADQAPPPSGGHPPQWPIHLPMNALNFQPNPQIAPAPPFPAPGYPMDYNLASFYANSQMAGAGNSGTPGMFYPPPFPFMNQLDPSQPPPPFIPAPIQAVYPPVPVPGGATGPSQAPSMAPRYDLNNHAVAQAELGKASSTTYRNREEGEVSESEDGHSRARKAPRSDRRESELEEGETVSARSPSRSSNKSSSPYIPPISVTTDSELVNRAIESQRGEIASSASAIDPQTLRTVTQLRVQAQGALLSLLPYGISYHELVAEGVDSRVLRSLYEDVGVKIPSPPPEKSTDPESFKSESKSNPAGSASQVSEQQKPVPGSNANTQPPVSATSETAAQKPLERKELIARMLAEKAAKKSEPSTTQSSPKGSQAATPAPLPKKPAAVPVRPKNKAQTDLARQRIEELKRQALLKSKLKAQPITNSNVEPENKSLESVADSKPVLHPLPVRPPAPQLLEGATIPGLSMAGSQAEKRTPEQLPSESQGVRVEPAPVARASQRKRPRASDFDEPEWGYKKLSNQEVNQLGLADRLVIDISEDDDEEGDGKGNDDDSIYGDNQDAMDVDSFPAGHSETVVTSSNSRPTLQKYPSGGRTSTSTPQGSSRPSDSEHIRQRDLEIQNMYRRIEELEQKRKAKLAASQIDSAQVTDGTPDGSCASSGSSAMQLSPVDGHATGNSEPASTAVPMPATGTLDETCAQDKAQVSNPTNEASSNTRSSSEALNVGLHGVTGSKCFGLSTKHNGSLADVQATDAPGIGSGPQSSDSSSSSSSGSTGGSMEETQEILSSSEDTTSDEDDSLSDSSGSSTGPQTNGGLVEVRQSNEATAEPLAEVSMDQTSDQLEEPSPISQAASESPINTASAVATMVPNPSTSVQSNVELAGHPLPARPPVSVSTGDMMEIEGPAGPNKQFHRESSEVSQAYEPPEPPEPPIPQDAEDSAYSPPFSPAPPASVEVPAQPDAKSTAMPPVPSAHEVPTNARQPTSYDSRHDPQVILGNEASSKSVGSGFTPYVSPLRYFKAYRYHPGFAEDVPDGYRSLTYSHDIDPMKYLCPYEATGGVCNDRSCKNQHFRDMTLSDDKILIQMGSVREGETEQEREAYLAGLKEIINEMRREKVKDFGSVAAEIAAYRRRFLQDPSRVLPL